MKPASLFITGALAAAALAGITVHAEVEALALAAARDAARTTALSVEAELDRIERQVAWLLRPGAETTEAADAAFILDTTPAIAGLRRVDGSGRTIYAADRVGFVRDTSDVAHTRAVLAADPDKPWMSPVRRAGDRPHADLALMRHGDPGVAIADLDLAFFGDVFDAAVAAPGTRFALTDEAGTPIAGDTGPDAAVAVAVAVPIPRADWTLRVTAAAPSLPFLRLIERFVAFGGIMMAATTLGRWRAARR